MLGVIDQPDARWSSIRCRNDQETTSPTVMAFTIGTRRSSLVGQRHGVGRSLVSKACIRPPHRRGICAVTANVGRPAFSAWRLPHRASPKQPDKYRPFGVRPTKSTLLAVNRPQRTELAVYPRLGAGPNDHRLVPDRAWAVRRGGSARETPWRRQAPRPGGGVRNLDRGRADRPGRRP